MNFKPFSNNLLIPGSFTFANVKQVSKLSFISKFVESGSLPSKMLDLGLLNISWRGGGEG